MITKLEFFIPFRYLKAKNNEGFISIVTLFSLIGIALGVATLIIVMSVMSGYEVQLMNRILGINGHISITSSKNIKDFAHIIKSAEEIRNVRYSVPLINGQGLISTSNGNSKGVFVKGIDGIDLEKKSIINQSVTSIDEMKAYQNNEGVLVGVTMAQELGISVGDYIKLISPKIENLVFGMMPRIKSFKVIGVFDVGMYEYNSNILFMPLQYAQLFFEYKNSVTDIEIQTSDVKQIDIIISQLKNLLNDDMSITDWTSANQSLAAALKVERNVMFLILMLIILIAAFNIISSLIMLVQEKKRSIAILKTIGLQRSSIIKIFVICGSLIGFTGTFLGAILGILFTLNVEKIRQFLESMTGITIFDPVIYFLTSLPSELSIANTVIIVMISLLLSFLATIYPAWKASSVMPAVSLRYE